MYFVKARKHLEEQDAKERQEKSRRDRSQRSDAARLTMHLQALSQQTKTKTDEAKASTQSLAATSSLDTNIDASGNSRSNFKPEELPDGAFCRPNKDLRNLQSTGSSSAAMDDAPGAGNKPAEYIRRAEYIGTFSVSGSDKEARERQMESQLEQMRSARDRRPVNLIISSSGVKVVLHENNNVFMEHSLKRIWYATCDPEYCQFSFLAREPKTSAEVQYCHAFVTQTSQQAEELIALIGEAFRSTDSEAKKPPTEAKKPPTFHELIEQQVQQQQAKFRETEKEAQSALQQKLKEIAMPTPFSEKAQFRMEQRRKSEDISLLVGQEKLLAKQQVDQHGVKHSYSPDKSGSIIPVNRRSEIPTRQNTPHPSPLKRNSVPTQAATMSSPVPSSSSPNPLSIMAIKESIETRSSNTKFKGSPVTALKNEIDRRLSMTNGEDIQLPSAMERDLKKDQVKILKQPPKAMTNRPLPLPPSLSKSPQQSRRQPGGQQPQQQSHPQQSQHSHLQKLHPALHRHSLDDYHLPRSSSSQIPLSSNTRGAAGNVIMRDSPKRRQPRPMSEIATSSSGAAGVSAGSGRGLTEQQTLLNNFATNFSLSTHTEIGTDGVCGHSTVVQEPQQGLCSTQQERARDFAVGEGVKLGDAGGEGSDGLTYFFQKSAVTRPLNSSHTQVNPATPDVGHLQPAQSSRLENTSYQDAVNVSVLRYQNDSPFQNDRPEKGSKHPAGFESLMCLDRSHIHDEALRSAPWYHAGLPREIALEILQQEEVGSFIVRDSTSHPGCYALSVRVPKYENAAGISHYLILRTHRGVKLKGLDKEWSTLTALVTHHTVMRELLPCTLRLPKVKGQATEPSSTIQNRGGDGSASNDDENNLNIDHCGQSQS